MIIKEYKGAYERTVLIEIEVGTCKRCGNITKVLSMDGSDGEYSVGCLCKECIDESFVKEKEEK